ELVCNRTFDKFSCWPDTMPNSTASVPCPWFLPWYEKVKHRHVFKTCGPDGQWVTGPRGQSLRDATQCEQDDEDLKAQEKFAKTYGSFKVMYTVGYSVSLCALLLALALLLGFSKLHCMRNYIHMNLFASFILKGVSVLVIDALLKTHYSDKIDGYNVQVWLSDEAAAGCRAATVFMQYGIVANYCWLLVEGIYLHNLLVVAVFSERSYFTLYLLRSGYAPHTSPPSSQGMLVAILYCFVNKEVSRTAGARAAGAWGHTDSCCPQVQAELLKRWQRWKLGKDLAEEYKHTYSHAPSARNGAGSTCEKHQLVSGCANGLGRSLAPHPSSQRPERSGRSTAEHLALEGHHHCYEFPETTAESHF
ncbi:GLR protein, partial [Ptilorrhoa leucosticta]|nr:GLR protein [Ptilorrhoa leucosticta]